jgi:hypothetical protein
MFLCCFARAGCSRINRLKIANLADPPTTSHRKTRDENPKTSICNILELVLLNQKGLFKLTLAPPCLAQRLLWPAAFSIRDANLIRIL